MGVRKNLFIVWNPFQRRSETLSGIFDLKILYFHFKWEEKGKFFKAISYIPKFFLTMWAFQLYRPKYVFVQLAPTTLLYTVALYSFVGRSKYISDCHNTMIYDDHWINWPFAVDLLKRSYITITHNNDVHKLAEKLGVQSMILRDPLPVMNVNKDIDRVAGIDIKERTYVIIPCGMAPDEPVKELFDVARSMPDLLFVMTWFKEGVPEEMRSNTPDNLHFSGFLQEPEFNSLYANANISLVLTTREGTQPSGAAEAIALGIPLVVSDIATTRRLYNDSPVFVQNEPDSIIKGLKYALEHQDELSDSVSGLRESLIEDAEIQIRNVKSRLAKID